MQPDLCIPKVCPPTIKVCKKRLLTFSCSGHTETDEKQNISGIMHQYTVLVYLKDSEQRLPERVEVAARFVVINDEVELAAEQLHAEKREDDDEEEQQQ